MLQCYNHNIFPKLMNRSLGQEGVSQLRRELLTAVIGDVLEIGFGSGLNQPCYPDHVQKVTSIDVNWMEPCFSPSKIQVEKYTMSAEELDFLDNSFDTVVSTFTLCSIQTWRSISLS
jgi:ubiquinone/menaquinone biosynthesis C-methylase UbiE